MLDFTQNIHPLTRDGRSQADRQNLRALSPDSARPDMRDEKQLLAYLYEFAKAVIFENEDGTQDNWQEFFRTGSSVQLALIAQFDPETLQRDFKEAQTRWADGLEAGNFYPLLDFIFETALSIDRWFVALSSDTEFIDGQLIINENPLRLTIQNLIQSNLQTALKQLIGTANSLSDFNIAPLSIQYQIEPDLTVANGIALEIAKTRYVFPNFEDDTKTRWDIQATDFSIRDTELQIAMNAPHTFKYVAIDRLNNLFSIFYKAVTEIVGDTEGVDVLQPTQMHEPHLGLIYAFLRLFKFAQSDLNEMPKRHLDFYFRQVLGLKPRPFVPDEAHLVFEINKPFSTVKIGEKTSIKDGKDNNKADIEFKTTDELIATKAKIGSLRTLHHDTNTTLFAAPIANSKDGNGADFLPETDKSWAALGSTDTPTARVGLMVASPALRLAEGTRDVIFTIDLSSSIAKKATQLGFKYNLSQTGFTILFPKGDNIKDKKTKSFLSTEKDKIKAIKYYYEISDETAIVGESDLLKEIEQSLVSTIDVIQNMVEYRIAKKAYDLLKKNGIDFDKNKPNSFVSFETSKLVDLKSIYGLKSWLNTQDTIEFWKNVQEISVFDIQLSGEKGWFRATKLPKIEITSTQLIITINLGLTDEPVFVADPSVLKADFGVKEPLMKLELNHKILNDSSSFYDVFKDVKITGITLKTDVKGVTNIIIQNQNGLLDAKSAFQPFGPQPKGGDVFYIGSDELFRKKLTSLTLNINWKEVLDANYYQYYDDAGFSKLTSANFEYDTDLLKKGFFEKLESKTPLFDATHEFKPIKNDIITAPSVLTPFLPNESRQGFIRLILNRDFQHNVYQIVAEKRAAKIISDKLDAKTMPKVPYTPSIQSLTIDYTATDSPTNTLQAFHLLPFDETNRIEMGVDDYLLPRFELVEQVDGLPTKFIEGALYIGLQDANVSETLSLLFQLNEPSADSYLNAAKIEWSYLIDNQWHKLNDGEHILSDTTEGFIRSGIVRLVLPYDLSSKNTTILPPQYHWLRAVTDLNSAATCRVLGVHTQAVKAVFKNNGNDLLRLDKPLAADLLKKMDAPLAELKSVAQPYPTFGGRAPETDSAFYKRTSETLRHKGRAVTLNDYENLVLSAFPDVYKVKCLTHTLAQKVSKDALDKLIAPGNVTIVVIPDLANSSFVERFEPKVSRGRLDDIYDFLKSRTTPFVQLKVMNPIFEKIHTSSKITFVKGKSPAFYKNQLDLDLKRYLAPWAFDPTAKIEFGGQIFPSAILGFIEQREYVDFVEDFKVSKELAALKANVVLDDEGVLTTTTARGIFVTGEHRIDF